MSTVFIPTGAKSTYYVAVDNTKAGLVKRVSARRWTVVLLDDLHVVRHADDVRALVLTALDREQAATLVVQAHEATVVALGTPCDDCQAAAGEPCRVDCLAMVGAL